MVLIQHDFIQTFSSSGSHFGTILSIIKKSNIYIDLILEQYQFEKYFKHLLFDHKKLVIPGLGRFFLDRLPASFSVDRLQISPPSYHLRFEKDFIQQDYDSVHFLKKYYPATSENEFSNYSKHLVNKLLTRGHIKIDDLGRLHFQDGEIIYEKDIETQNMLTKGFPVLTLSNLRTLFPPVLPATLERIGGISGFWARWIPFAIAAILTLGVIGLGYKINQTSISPPPKKENKPPLVNIDSLNESGDVDTNDISNEGEEVKDSMIKSIEDSGTNAAGVKTKKCIIITGAYKTRRYKDLMIENLEKRGLKVFTETSSSGLTRVGFEFECAETDLQQYLDSIRTAIQNDAWYLIPDFSKKQG